MDLLSYPQINYLLEKTVQLYPDKIALVDECRSISYAELFNESVNFAKNLRAHDCKQGCRIVVHLGNQIETVITFWAVFLAGAVPVLVNPNMPTNKLNYIIEDSGSVLLINSDNYQQFSAKSSDGEAIKSARTHDDLATIIYTSGSTGEAKGVMLSHKNMLAATRSLNAYLHYAEQDKVLCVSPLSFDYGLYQMIMSISVGATLYLVNSMLLPGKVLKLIAQERLTIVPGVPTLFTLLNQYQVLFKQDLSSITKVTNTGAALNRNHIDIIQNLFPNAKIFSMYGLTECKRCTYLPPSEINLKPDSVGIAIPYTKIWIADELGNPMQAGQLGQLVVEGDTVMQGYWNKPEETAKKVKQGKLFTGDYGYLDEQGYFYFKGRMDQSVKIRGQKVSVREVESVIGSFPGIMNVAVIAKPELLTGEYELHAYFSTTTKISDLALREFCKENLEPFKLPAHFHMLKSLPKTNNGKLNRHELAQPGNLVELITKSVHSSPDSMALWVDDQTISYKELFDMALTLSPSIHKANGETCLLFCKRSLTAYRAIYACLLAGKAYVPMNPRLPAERNQLVAEDSLAKVVVIDSASAEQAATLFANWQNELVLIFPEFETAPEWALQSRHQIVCKNDLVAEPSLHITATEESPACLLFTSGSTGRPKGVLLKHKNLLSYWHSGMKVYHPTKADRFAQITELTFDLSMHDIFLAWGVGASLYVLPEKLYGSLKFFIGLSSFVQRHQLTFWMSVPSSAAIMKQLKLLKANSLPSLRCTVFCGEPLAESLASAWHLAAPNSTIFNLYGPTEATIGFTIHEWQPNEAKEEVVSIGKPLPGQEVCLLDDQGNPVEDGCVGELYLGGDQVVEGYWKNEHLTKQRFINKKVKNKKANRWYRTGDLVKQGTKRLSFVGRADDQFQIRGCRVEKLEIENELKKITGTDLVAVVPWPYSEDGILLGVVAFVSGCEHDQQTLSRKAKQILPDYMVPSQFHFLDQLPLGGTGKVDYQKLKLTLREKDAVYD